MDKEQREAFESLHDLVHDMEAAKGRRRCRSCGSDLTRRDTYQKIAKNADSEQSGPEDAPAAE